MDLSMYENQDPNYDILVVKILHIGTQARNMNQHIGVLDDFYGFSGIWKALGAEAGFHLEKPEPDYGKNLFGKNDIYHKCKELGKLGFLIEVAPVKTITKWYYGDTFEEAYQKALAEQKEYRDNYED